MLGSCGWETTGRPPDAPAPTSATASPTLTLAVVGDIMLDRGVGRKIDHFGIDYPFKHVTDVLSAADIAFGNLECPLSENGTKVLKPICFKAKVAAAQCLVKAGFDVLSLANNHTMDCGRRGLADTMERLGLKGLKWCGAGSNRAEAESAAVIETKGIRVAFVAFCGFLPEGTFLRDDKPTIAFASEETVRRAVTAAEQQGDVVVASFHWGVEYNRYPSQQQRDLARVALEAGADLVVGHHPHVLQAIDLTPSRSLIAYSLGNFVFDQWRGRGAESVILQCKLSKGGVVEANRVPVELVGFRPHLTARKPEAFREGGDLHQVNGAQ